MSNISYRAKLVRLEGDGLGQPRASGHSDERKRVWAEVGSFLVRLIGGIIAVALLWILVSRFVVPALIASAYRGESLPFLNSIISGQAIHPLELYLTSWETISWRVLGMMFVVGLIPLPLVATGPEVQSYFEARYGNAWTLMPGVLTTILSLVGFMSIFYLFYFYPVGYVYLITEDQWGEYGTFVSWAMASCFLTWMLIKDRGVRKPAFVLLALGTFFVAMEEISWGQRIVGLGSPAVFVDYNLQREINLHNLAPGIAWRLSWVVIIAIFLWGILPLFTRKWGWLRKWCDKLGIPIVRIHLWPLFLLAIFFTVSCPLLRCDELRELFLGIAIAILSLDLVLTMRRGTRVRPAPATIATASLLLTLGILTAFLVRFYSWEEELRGELNEFATKAFPKAGMYRQADMLFEYMNKHPQFLGPETRLRQGALLIELGQDTKARQVLELALADPKKLEHQTPQDDPAPHRIKGQMLVMLGRQQEAQAAFQDAIEKDRARLEQPNDSKAEARIRWSLARTLLAMGDSGAASEQLSIARALADRRTRYLIDQWMQENFHPPSPVSHHRSSLVGQRDS